MLRTGKGRALVSSIDGWQLRQDGSVTVEGAFAVIARKGQGDSRKLTSSSAGGLSRAHGSHAARSSNHELWVQNKLGAARREWVACGSPTRTLHTCSRQLRYFAQSCNKVIISRYAVLLNTFQIDTSCSRCSSSSKILHPYSPSPMNCDICLLPFYVVPCVGTHFVLEYLNCLRTRLGMRKRCLGPKGSICTFGSMRTVRGSESLAHAPSGNNARLQRPLLPTTGL